MVGGASVLERKLKIPYYGGNLPLTHVRKSRPKSLFDFFLLNHGLLNLFQWKNQANTIMIYSAAYLKLSRPNLRVLKNVP
jgi:hypothetical protein